MGVGGSKHCRYSLEEQSVWAVYGQGMCLGKYRILTDKTMSFQYTVNFLMHS